MLSKALFSVVYGLILFVSMVGMQQIFGERDVHLTNYPDVEDASFHMAIGTFIALSLIYRGRWIGNLIHAAVYAVIVFGVLVVLEQVFGHHEYHFTQFTTAEDFAKFAALGMFLTLLMYGDARVKVGGGEGGKPGSGSDKLANSRPPVGNGSAARKSDRD